MGDRVLMQCYSKAQGTHGPVVYGHWLGSEAPKIAAALIKRMGGRRDVDYASARLVQEAINAQGGDSAQYGNLGVGVWCTYGVLSPEDSHGDAGCVLINVDDWSVQYLGGYYKEAGTTKSTMEGLYERLGA